MQKDRVSRPRIQRRTPHACARLRLQIPTPSRPQTFLSVRRLSAGDLPPQATPHASQRQYLHCPWSRPSCGKESAEKQGARDIQCTGKCDRRPRKVPLAESALFGSARSVLLKDDLASFPRPSLLEKARQGASSATRQTA